MTTAAMTTASPELWVVVAQASRAALYTGPLTLDRLEDQTGLAHPASRARGRELVSDDAGRRAGGGTARSATSPASEPKAREADAFARALVDHLEQARNADRLAEWILVAPPAFLGRMRSALTPGLAAGLRSTLARDYTTLPPQDLASRLRDHYAQVTDLH